MNDWISEGKTIQIDFGMMKKSHTKESE